MKIEDCVKLHETVTQKNEALRQELSSLTSSLTALKEKMSKAESDGDLSAYKAAKDEYEGAQFRIRALRSRLAKPQYDVPEIEKAWHNYATRHNRAFSEKMDDFKEKVFALGKDYKELVMLQNEAQYKKRCCGDLLPLGKQSSMDGIESLPVGDFGEHPDIAFFKLYGALTSTEAMNAQLIENGSVVESLSDDSTSGIGGAMNFLHNIN